MIYPSGDIYDGDFEDGLKQGFGILITAEGDKYEGRWSDNYKNGPGKEYISSTQEYFEGTFFNGKREGPGILVDKNGNVFELNWTAGQVQGNSVSLKKLPKGNNFYYLTIYNRYSCKTYKEFSKSKRFIKAWYCYIFIIKINNLQYLNKFL